MSGAEAAAEVRPKRVTIVDVAAHAGVSTASASKVLRDAYGVSEPMKQRVRASMLALGYRPYRPARGMRGRTFTIGMMVSDIDNPFFSMVADGVGSVVRPRGFEQLLALGGYETAPQTAVVDALVDHQMDGLILVAPTIERHDLERIAREVPLVVVGCHSDSAVLDSVSGDDEFGSALVVDHLVELGHRRIAFVTNHQDVVDPSRPESARLAGFSKAMARHGLDADAVVVESHWSLEGGREALRVADSLQEPPTALFGGADITALGIMSALSDEGRAAPEAYSLAGYDNSRMASLGPISLTTVDQSGFEMGQTAGRLLLERIDGRTTSSHILITPRLVARATTAEPARP